MLVVLISVPLVLSIIQLTNAASKVVDGYNKPKEAISQRISSDVLDKIDRNFYERFGDVQAFAVNNLAKSFLTQPSNDSSSVSKETQSFVNTMVSYYVLYDLMMICDIHGNVKMVNTKNNAGEFIESSYLLSRNVSYEPWFQKCISSEGPEGGAWFSDFMVNQEVKNIYKSNGFGMSFAAPIKNNEGEVIGVWYNFANWNEVTQSIRLSALKDIRQSEPSTKIFIVNNSNKIIDSDDESDITSHRTIKSVDKSENGFSYSVGNTIFSKDDYISGKAISKGAYTYPGKRWKAITLMEKNKLSLAVIFGKDLLGIVGLIVVLLTIAILLSVLFVNDISKKLKDVESVLSKLSLGELTTLENSKVQNDEIGIMIQSVQGLTENFKKTAAFSENIGKGNLDAEFVPLSEKDVLGNSLLTMRSNLKQVKESEAKRNWIVEGLAKFNEFTRDTSNVTKFYDDVLSNLIRYIHANQGYFYVLNDENPEELYMEIKSVYAYGKQKYLEEKKMIKYKQGLVGQAWFDKEALYFTEVPQEYVTITSGMGESTPTCIFIIPLMVNENVFGAIEIASFEPLEDYKVEFITKLSETLASTVSSVKTNERTRILLQASQEAEQALSAQEEEIRQNMEEMSATQAEMERVQRTLANEKKRIEDELEAQLNIINQIAIVSKTDLQGNITFANDEFVKWSKYSREELIGANHRILRHEDMPAEAFEEMWRTISHGKIWRGEVKNKAKDGSFYWVDAIIAPVLDANGKPKEYIAQRFVINEKKALEEQLKIYQNN